MASSNNAVEYKLIANGVIPSDSEYFDIVWVCLVLGGIVSNKELTETANEINRVLKTNGLFILIENTENKKDSEYWKYRTIEMYQKLFSFIELTHETDYSDLEERISIMTGRKYV